MTREEIQNMEAGTAMDILILEHIFNEVNYTQGHIGDEASTEGIILPGTKKKYTAPHYSTDIATAWQVVEHFKSNRYTLRWIDDENVWMCGELENHYGDEVWHNQGISHSAPLAICRAALLSKLCQI